MRYFPFFAILIAVVAHPIGNVHADEVEWEEERTEESFIPRYAVAGSYFTWSGDTDFSNVPGSVSQVEAGAQGNVPILMRDNFRLTAGFQYRWNRIDFSGAPAPLGNKTFNLHRVDIPFNLWMDLDNRWKLWVRLQPGWYSDFSHVNSDDFILTTLALLSYRLNDSTKVAFGAYYSRDLGEARLLPALGFIFEPNQHWSLALTFPRAEAAYAPSEDWLFTGRALLSGSGWNIADPAGGPNDVDLDYKSVRVGFGVDRRISGAWWGYLDAGVQFGQEITIEGAPYVFAQDLDSSAYGTLGVKLRF
tara:strand:- start:1600 stop:2511 length:912 start_codon:yes stop_codon:yes gene_type:complete